MNLFTLLEEAARRSPDSAAIVKAGAACTYGDLYSDACRLAKDFATLDLGGGARVGVMFANGPEYIAAAFAVLAAGGVVVSISPAVTAADIAAMAKDVDLDGFCYSARFAPLIAPLAKGESLPRAILSGKEPLLIQRSARKSPAAAREALRKLNAATIRSSSGTTGRAKGIMVSHAALFERAKTYCAAPPLDERAAVLWLRPMARPEIYAFVRQAATIVVGDAMNPLDAAERVRLHGVTHVYAAPIFYRTLLGEPDIGPGDFATVKYFLTGGSALGRTLADAFAARYEKEIVEHYGSAECATVLMNASLRSDKRGSAGVPVRAEVKLAGAEDAGAEVTGELLVRCPGMFDGYYKPWRSREEVLEDGWFRTGDLARRDADGYYWIIGRTKEVINVGGMKVFPQELEDILLAHPAVEEALVYAAPAPRFGEAPRAQVKLRPGVSSTEKEILDFANANLSVFRMLRGVEFVDEIPKTPTGKARRWKPASD